MPGTRCSRAACDRLPVGVVTSLSAGGGGGGSTECGGGQHWGLQVSKSVNFTAKPKIAADSHPLAVHTFDLFCIIFFDCRTGATHHHVRERPPRSAIRRPPHSSAAVSSAACGCSSLCWRSWAWLAPRRSHRCRCACRWQPGASWRRVRLPPVPPLPVPAHAGAAEAYVCAPNAWSLNAGRFCLLGLALVLARSRRQGQCWPAHQRGNRRLREWHHTKRHCAHPCAVHAAWSGLGQLSGCLPHPLK